MIRKYGLLLKIQFLNLFGINRIMHSHDKKEKRQLVLMGFAWLIVLAVLVAYSTLYSYACVQIGIVNTLPAIMLLLCSVITLFLTFMKSNGVLFGMRDYDVIMSLPVNSSVVVLSRITMVYIMNLLISFIVIAPSIVIYGINVHATVSVYLMLALTLFLAPLIPMILAMAVGVIITAVSIRFRHKNIVTIILSIAVTLAVIFFSMNLQNGSMQELADLGIAVEKAVNYFYPPAGLFGDAVLNNDWVSYGLFTLISIGCFVLFVAVISKFYSQINTAMFSYSKRNDYRISELKASDPFSALYRKELRRLFSCTVYALNCCIGAVLLVVLGVVLLFINPEQIAAQLELGENVIVNYIQCVPYVISIFIGMSSTTCVALSLEGRYRWLMCSAPVKSETIFNSKIAVNLTVLLPASLIGGVLFSFALKTDFLQTIFMILIPFAFSFFISTVGMLLNVKYPIYDWTSEYYAVKGGSTALLLTLLIGMITPLVLLGLNVVFLDYGLLIQVLGVCFILIITISIYQRLKRTKLYA